MLLTPRRCRASFVSERVADVGEHEWLGDALHREPRSDIPDLERPTPGSDHGDPEQVRRCLRQHGDVVRDGAAVVASIPLVGVGDDLPDLRVHGEIAGRHPRWCRPSRRTGGPRASRAWSSGSDRRVFRQRTTSRQRHGVARNRDSGLCFVRRRQRPHRGRPPTPLNRWGERSCVGSADADGASLIPGLDQARIAQAEGSTASLHDGVQAATATWAGRIVQNPCRSLRQEDAETASQLHECVGQTPSQGGSAGSNPVGGTKRRGSSGDVLSTPPLCHFSEGGSAGSNPCVIQRRWASAGQPPRRSAPCCLG